MGVNRGGGEGTRGGGEGTRGGGEGRCMGYQRRFFNPCPEKTTGGLRHQL